MARNHELVQASSIRLLDDLMKKTSALGSRWRRSPAILTNGFKAAQIATGPIPRQRGTSRWPIRSSNSWVTKGPQHPLQAYLLKISRRGGHLGELLTCSMDDPSITAGRVMDWEEFISSYDCRYVCIIYDLASGFTMLDTARACRIPYHDIRELRDRLMEDLEEFMGPSAIADAVRVPRWRGNIQVDKEKMACRADRRRLG